MIRTLPLALLALLAVLALAALLALAAPALAADPAPAPSEIVAAAPKADWMAIPASDLLVMDLAPDVKGKPRRVVIQLMSPPFSQGWIGNIRKLAAAHWWDGLSINRVQDNYVAQWGDADGEDKAKAKALPVGLAVVPASEYIHFANDMSDMALPRLAQPFDVRVLPDPYAGYGFVHFESGWPTGRNSAGEVWPVHCYGMVGVGRNLSPDTGSGAELYTVIGHAPRHLDRNIALVGRVIEGIEHLSSLPRGTGALGFYETPGERTKILSIRLGTEVAALPAYEYLATESETFARYADARANRRDPFFIKPAGGADICNIPVPVRRAK
ncbi:peptidylprolyl isomerase [Novosphingobium sp. Gsoil 351]|uniref:peptidylprolyl isomerase n=1 Tax=Novosphingobium sp. Gsoil 351 TaxID=2675225 RepID=UPI0012B4FFCC|nr:peptidylprolyl isomerase [Novosphingobium sp. Gsoil 351]QGN55966.1 peptidylprolyl isomerase [Novosphingobium sp. Gsoil 351]